MTARGFVVFSAVLVALGTRADSAQTGQASVAPRAETGVITGTVKSAGTGAPIRGVRVMLSDSSTPPRTAFTDGQGKFSFTALPPGRFALDAVHPAFLPASYGQKKPGKPGTAIELTAAQRLDLQIRLLRGSAITGVVTGEEDDPLIGARVRALRFVVNQNGVRRLRVVNEVQADDRGVYRFFNLEPGEYFVSAAPISDLEQADRATQTAMLEQGLLPDLAALEALHLRTADGRAEVNVEGYAPTYHPRSATAAGSIALNVDGITEHTGVDVHVALKRTATIRGTVGGALGPSVAVQVLLHNTDAAEEPTSQTTTVGRDGAFALRDVAPGHYTVYAQTVPAADGSASSVAEVRAAAFERLHGSVPVIVDGFDPPPLAIVLRPGRSISGSIVLDLAQPPVGQAPRTMISITPSPRPAGLPAFNTSPQVQVNADGLFTLQGIRPGQYFLRASGPGMVRSVVLNGVDTLDFPLEVTAEADVSGVVITMTDRPSELSGLVTDSTGKPTNDCTVIVLSTDSRFWMAGSRRVATTQPAVDGRYRFLGLPAGEYRVAVLSDFDPASRFDQSFLRQLAGESVVITIADGRQHSRDLRVVR